MIETGSIAATSPQYNGSSVECNVSTRLAKKLTKIRRRLHSLPELGYQEVETSAYLCGILGSSGLEIHRPLAGTGFCVDIEGGLPGPVIGYRAEMDALSLRDAKQVPYASRNAGAVHACGHDAHMTVAVGVALVLAEIRRHLPGTVRVFFQPNEEGTPSGSVPMIRDGVLDGLEAVYCVHVDPTLDIGVYGLRQGTVTAATDRFLVRVCAPSTGHSARPHKAKDTIWIATLLLQQFYQLVGRISDARNPAVCTVCLFRGGTAHNVIPSDVEFEGSLRFLDMEDRVTITRFMRHTAEQFAALHDVKITLDFINSLPCVINHELLGAHMRRTVSALFSPQAIFEVPVPSMGSEDFANYLEYVPGFLLRVGTRGSMHTSYPLHDAQFDVDERMLAPTVRLMSTALLGHLEQRILG